jgi:tRNA G18 (ribose-2'-O)-methylase SpoU
VLLCPECSDPLYRRSVRVSTGRVLTVPWTRAAPWPGVIDTLASRGFTVLALTPGPDALRIDELPSTPDRVAIMLGAEGPGLSLGALSRATRRVRIPMAAGVDSVNVAVAGALAFARFAPRGRLS